MTNTVTACNSVNLLDKATYDQQPRPDTELWAVDEESDSTYKGMVAGWAMPSDNYEELSLGASGSNYTAPANGYFVLNKTHGANTNLENISLKNLLGGTTEWTDGIITRCFWTQNGSSSGVFIPARKGDVVNVTYTASGNTNAFRFYYAKGEV